MTSYPPQQPPPPPYYNGANNNYAGESDDFMANRGDGFSEIKIRHAFIRKVYSIISFQMLITVAFVATFSLVDSVAGYFRTNIWFLYLFMIATFVIMIVLACCESVSRSFPLNMILLFVFTICESFLLGAISSTYQTSSVLIAVGITAVVVVAITIFAFQTKIDFTGMGIYLFVAVLLLFLFGLIAAFVRTKMMNIIYGALGAGIFSMYLIFDTQLMLGGKHKYSISPEDYIMAALNLYVDIVNLFLMILRLVGAARD